MKKTIRSHSLNFLLLRRSYKYNWSRNNNTRNMQSCIQMRIYDYLVSNKKDTFIWILINYNRICQTRLKLAYLVFKQSIFIHIHQPYVRNITTDNTLDFFDFYTGNNPTTKKYNSIFLLYLSITHIIKFQVLIYIFNFICNQYKMVR